MCESIEEHVVHRISSRDSGLGKDILDVQSNISLLKKKIANFFAKNLNNPLRRKSILIFIEKLWKSFSRIETSIFIQYKNYSVQQLGSHDFYIIFYNINQFLDFSTNLSVDDQFYINNLVKEYFI